MIFSRGLKPVSVKEIGKIIIFFHHHRHLNERNNCPVQIICFAQVQQQHARPAGQSAGRANRETSRAFKDLLQLWLQMLKYGKIYFHRAVWKAYRWLNKAIIFQQNEQCTPTPIDTEGKVRKILRRETSVLGPTENGSFLGSFLRR